MPSYVAAILCWILIFWMIRRDAMAREPFAGSLWVPLLWLLILGSRPLSYWVGSGGGGGEGNTFDRNIYLIFWFLSLVLLNRAGINWSAVIADNWPIVLFYGFLLTSCLWSDGAFVTFKRWFKDLSAVFVGLVILSQRDPREALEAVVFRVAIVLMPCSVMLLKYFPQHGRRYSVSGGLEVTGVADQKNSLGEMIMAMGLVIIWCLADRHQQRDLEPVVVKRRRRSGLFVLTVGLYMLWQSDSKTAMLCMAVGSVVILSDRLPLIGKSPKAVLGVALISPALYMIGNSLFGLTAGLLRLLGRDPTLTNRTKIWDVVLSKDTDPMFGEGYLMFWDKYNPIILDGYPVMLKTAHNGYLEMYLDGGWIGVGFLMVMLLGVGVAVSREFLTGSHFGRLQLAIFVAVLIYNYSESSFGRRGSLWFAFLIFCANYGRAFMGRSMKNSAVSGPLPGARQIPAKEGAAG